MSHTLQILTQILIIKNPQPNYVQLTKISLSSICVKIYLTANSLKNYCIISTSSLKIHCRKNIRDFEV